MFAIERVKIIKDYLNKDKHVSVAKLSSLLNVTEVTIRRDLDSLAERRLPGSVLTDPEIVAAQAVAIASGRAVPTIDGGVIVVRAASLCLHGDTPGAVLLASVARDALVSSGVRVVSPWS